MGFFYEFGNFRIVMVQIKDTLEISTMNEDLTPDKTFEMCGYAGPNGFIKETYIRENLNFER